MGGEAQVAPRTLKVARGDLVFLAVDARDGNHSCDLTDVELVLDSLGDTPRQWSLTRDVSPDILAGNPHADRFGNEGVWHFYTEPETGGPLGPVVPAGSLRAKWQASRSAEEKQKLAGDVLILLTSAAPEIRDSPDYL